MSKQRFGIDFNSPVILGMTLLSLIALIGNMVTRGAFNYVISIYYTSWSDPFMYPRLFTHVIAHQDAAHFTSNFLLILAVGPLVEEKYGSGKLAVMVVITALVTGLINVIFSPRVMLLGASGIVFMLILLASFTNLRGGRIPLTVLLVGILYIGNEVVAGMTMRDNVSRVTHIAGGICGAGFGVIFNRRKLGGKS